MKVSRFDRKSGFFLFFLMYGNFNINCPFPILQEVELLARIEDKLHVPDKLRKHVFHDVCDVCQTDVQFLKGEALNMVQSLERTQTELTAPHRQGGVKMGSPRNVVQLPRTTPHYSPAHHRSVSTPAQLHSKSFTFSPYYVTYQCN